MAQNRISILVALKGADDGLKRTITSAERSLDDLAATARTAGAKVSAGLEQVKAGFPAFGEQVSRARTQLLAFASIQWATAKAQEIVQVADAWNMMSARLKLATAGQREFTSAQKALFDIAQRIGVPVQEAATLYGRLTADVVVNALQSHKDKLATEYAQLPQTVGQAFQRLSTLAREARFETNDFAGAEQRGVTGFSLHLTRLGRGKQRMWQGSFTRIGQRLEVLATDHDD